MVKEKLIASTKSEKIKLLTLLPRKWPINYIIRKFNVTCYSVIKSRALFKKHGILPENVKKTNTNLPEELIYDVKRFYESDDVSRLCPGIKDCITIKKEQFQKKMLLSNIKDIYINFLNYYKEKKNIDEFNTDFKKSLCLTKKIL